MTAIHFKTHFSFWSRVARAFAASLVASFTFLGSAIAQSPTTVAVTSTINPSTAGQATTLGARVSSTLLAADHFSGVGRSQGSALYFRYDLVNATFAAPLVPANLTNTTSPATFANVVIAQGGGLGESYVIYQVTFGAGGLVQGNNIRLLFRTTQTPGAGTPTITITVHDTAGSVFGQVPANTSVVFRRDPVALSDLAPPFTITGTITFRNGGVAIPGCAGLPILPAAVLCSATFATSGRLAVTADYSGDVNYAASTGTLTGGQVVGIAFSQSTLLAATVGVPYSVDITGAGGTAPYTIAVIEGFFPNGLTISPAGAIRGTPTTALNFEFRLRATDANGGTAEALYTMPVGKGQQTITFNLPATAVVGTSLPLNATTTSTLPISYVAGNNGVCTIGGTSIQLLTTGTCTVTPLQNGNQDYLAASTFPRSVSVQTKAGVQPLRVRGTNATSFQGRIVGNQLQFTADNDPGSANRVLGTVDVDGNGQADLLFQNITQGDLGEVRYWKDGAVESERILRSVRLAWRLDAVGDLDGDGFGDLVWRFTGQSPNIDDTGVSYIWFTNGTTVSQVRKRGGAPLSWTLLGATDINADGAADMIYISPNSDVRALMATSGRSCANLSAGQIPAGFTAVKLGSFLRTGRAEILLRNNTTGAMQVMVLDATGLTLPPFTADPNDPNAACTASSLAVRTSFVQLENADAAWQFFGTADFNGDGLLDVVWSRADGTTAIWLTTGDNQPMTVLLNGGTIAAGLSSIGR